MIIAAAHEVDDDEEAGIEESDWYGEAYEPELDIGSVSGGDDPAVEIEDSKQRNKGKKSMCLNGACLRISHNALFRTSQTHSVRGSIVDFD